MTWGKPRKKQEADDNRYHCGNRFGKLSLGTVVARHIDTNFSSIFRPTPHIYGARRRREKNGIFCDFNVISLQQKCQYD